MGKFRPLVLSGPSGVGKGTLISLLLKENDGLPAAFSVSHTTRSPRPGEIDGVHYHFVNHAAMEKLIAEGAFVEYARVHGNIYGTSKKAVEAVSEQRKVCILDIDVQGAALVNKSDPPLDAVFVFVMPPSMDELERRLRGRGTETEEKVRLRLAAAKREIELGRTEPFWDATIINTDIDAAYAQLREIAVTRCLGKPC